LNYFTPTKKPIDWTTGGVGRHRRVYDTPATPLDRLLAAGILSPAQQTELTAYRDQLDVMAIAQAINQIQRQLIKLAAGKTKRLEAAVKLRLPPEGFKPHRQ